ncbi:hypothetical protein KUTeg_021260 [Tegillarca granosa]|uniref:PX domain-containing protein kinase-like protein n=1 Tax=Tegillarca granosa TaxID=220873 RepID=A0ABQ9EAB1_TEGGR|nr:hypothetical protein KUTeg_021260 [Tegillarca granosa]
MSFFEKKKTSKVTLDDTVFLSCIVEGAQKQDDHIEYTLKVQRGPMVEQSWTVQKRYSDFTALDSELRVSNVELPLPPKRVFGNFDREFIAERKQGLQAYIDAIVQNFLLSNSLYFKRFLDQDHYSVNFTELALQHVSMVFRSEKGWDVVETLHDIGWRFRKSYIMVKHNSQPKIKQVLTWCDYGPDKFIPDKEMVAILNLFSTIQHPHIYHTEFATGSETGGLVIRNYCDKGTLRDYLCKCKPKNNYLKKYANPKITQNLDIGAIKMFGKQILETLKFLTEKGLPYCHLHCSNIILEDGCCKILDIENWLLGIPSYYRSFYTQFKKINSCESIDVYCFGHVIYEMCFGKPLNQATCDSYPPDCPAEIRSVLESILTTEACKNGLPSLSDLLLHPLFSDVAFSYINKPVLKIPSKLKEAIKTAKEDMERRLKEEQKIIHKVKRISKAKEFHMSEGEKKKRIKSKKKALESGDKEQPPKTPTSPTSPSAENGPAQSPMTPTAPLSAPAAPPAPPPPGPPPVAAPPPPAVAPPPPAAAVPPPPPPASSSGRGALLSSITGFSKGGLKKVATVDKSKPKL